MASLVLDNIPNHLLERLQNRARAEATTMEEQALKLLDQALKERVPFMEALARWRQANPDVVEEDANVFEGVRAQDEGRKVEL